jgi:hypothetical protein
MLRANDHSERTILIERFVAYLDSEDLTAVGHQALSANGCIRTADRIQMMVWGRRTEGRSDTGLPPGEGMGV